MFKYGKYYYLTIPLTVLLIDRDTKIEKYPGYKSATQSNLAPGLAYGLYFILV